jgi:hypothetical protein
MNGWRGVSWLSACAAVAIAVAWIWMHDEQADAAAPPTAGMEPAPVPATATDELREVPVVRSGVEPPARPMEPENAPSADREAGATRVRIAGLVVDIGGAPAPGVPLLWRDEPASAPLAYSDASGRFAFEHEPRAGTLVGEDDARTSVCGFEVGPSRPAGDGLIVVARAIDVEGIVVAPDGSPIGGAAVQIDLRWSSFASLDLPLDRTTRISRTTTTDERGEFRWERLPAVPGAELDTTARDCFPDRRDAPTEDRSFLRIELRPLQDGGTVVFGRVSHLDGRPAAEAEVRLGWQATKCEHDGDFELRVDWVPPSTPLSAILPGHQPSITPEFGVEVASARGPIGPLDLRLAGPALSIEGVALDASGAPLEGWSVSLVDATALTPNTVPPEFAEDLAAPGGQARATTDAAGKFLIGGLSSRRYRIQAWDARTLLKIRSEPIEAGARDVELRLEPDAVFERVTGRVRSPRGDPIGGVTVRVVLVTLETQTGSTSIDGSRTETAADGSFELGNVPRRWVRLALDGEAIIPLSHAMADRPDGNDLVAPRRCRFQIAEVADSTLTAISVEDSSGKSLMLYTFEQNQWAGTSPVPLAGGKTHVLSTSEEAATLVLHRGRGVAARRPLALDPASLVTLRL